MHASEQAREDVQLARRKWRRTQPTLDPSHLVFLDETGATTSMARIRGRSPRGTRCLAAVPAGHWQTTTFLAALRAGALTAPMVIDGPMNGALFLAYVRTFLCPTLRPGDLVIADNLSSHKVAGVADAIEAVGARLCFLPPYSPDLNPIEKVFAKLKALLRKAAVRDVEALWLKLGELLDAFSPEECRHYFASCGYVSR